ncbi:syntaxin-16 [Chrysoperla carnea]|uniref:syntaxin-16 n=1 Tax=Chrysoperla carnea TaxID=189513 RepID=UPI001D099BB0|nr:syntaxin-16 [Chrysoperla carnea]
MATRTLTDVFILMRNNAIQRRNIYSEQNNTDRMSLVSLNNAEEGNYYGSGDCAMPPSWISLLEEAQYSFSKLRDKITDLKTLHVKYCNRPTFDDSSKEDAEIEQLSQEISRMFTSSHRLIQQIKSRCYDGSRKEQKLTSNVVRALASTLQELSTSYRTTQSNYLKQINSREANTQNYFDSLTFEPQTPTDDLLTQSNTENIDQYFMANQMQKQMTQQQLVLLEEENTRFAQEREREVNQVVKTIYEINDIYKELAQMVSEQGTVLDRIDYNVELTQIQVQEGYKQLKKAENYQRKNRKMFCILILGATTILLTFLLIIVKF